MNIYLAKENKSLKRKYSGKMRNLLSLLNISPCTVIVIRKEKVITEEDVLSDTDSIKVLSVVSGG
ncbi:thiamine biosynthesis protein ThiS [Candidatus Woesearchaeota archaeon]|nr:thiamine biosynthesis protein ThiS [Candidatus Woesearchaeota archaeon]